jgi:hypothetical protein
MFELDEAESLCDAALDFVFGNMIFGEAVAYVVADGEGVKERAFLKDGADAGAEGEEVALLHLADVFPEEGDAACVGLEESVGELEEDAFSDTSGAEDDAVFSAVDAEGDVVEHGLAVEADGDVVEDDDGLAAGVAAVELRLGGSGHRPKAVMNTWVMKKSVAMMMMEA